MIALFRKLFSTPSKESPTKVDEESIKDIPQNLTYQELVSQHYQALGYTLEHTLSGHSDDIELIATRNNELLLIICKSYRKKEKYRINANTLLSYIEKCEIFYKKNPKYEKLQKKGLFVTKEDVMNDGAKALLKEKKFFVKHKVLSA
jgi:hypothetical protein